MIDLTKRKRVSTDLLLDLQAKEARKTDGDRVVTFKLTEAQAEKLYAAVAERYDTPAAARAGFWARWGQLEFEIV